MIKTLKQTISNMFYWIKKKLIQFKRWLILIIFGVAVVAAPLVLPPNIPDIALEKIQSKYEASELKGKYRLEKTAFILDAIDENAIQAEVGNKNSDSFEPSLTLRKWSDEVNFKVKYKHGEKEKDQKVDIENKKIKWKGKKTEVHYYEMKKGELLHDKVLEHDVYEVEVLLLEKPDTNIVGFDIETKGLSFYYQPELTQEEIDKGAFRPENVIGSYAVYHESKQGDYSKMGLKNYRAGIAFHIYRPKIIDSAGTEVWGKLNITDNLLTVEIPQEFLDNAVYPIRHAAGLTFGYETKGSSGQSLLIFMNSDQSDLLAGKESYSGGSANANDIRVALKNDIGEAVQVQCAIYDHDTPNDIPENIITNGITPTVDVPNATNDYVTFTYSTEPDLSNQTYWLAVKPMELFSLAPVEAISVWYNSVNGRYSKHTKTSAPVVSWLDPYSASASYDSKRLSIYCTYTAGGAAERRMFLTQ